jgi:adenylate kinase
MASPVEAGGFVGVADGRAKRVLCFLLLGPPGAGKGTQAAIIARRTGVARISTGEMLRDAIARKTPLGEQAAPLMNNGHLVPDSLLVALIAERVTDPDCANGLLLDGFPRTVNQAEALDQLVTEHGMDLVVLNFDVPRAVLLRRLSGRRWCPSCQATYHLETSPSRKPGICDQCGSGLIQRPDDNEGVVAKRLEAYEAQTVPVIQHYEKRGPVHRVDGYRDVNDVFAEIETYLGVSH